MRGGCFTRGLIATVVVLVLAFVLLGKLLVSDVQVSSIASPDRRLVATVREIDGGATSDFAYRVDIRPKGWTWYQAPRRAFWGYGVIRSDCAYGVTVGWRSNTALEVRFLSVNSGKPQRDIEVVNRVAIDGRIITVTAVPGRVDPTAPCGPMARG